MRLPERDMIFRLEDIELIPEATPERGLPRNSPEWVAELNRCLESLQRFRSGDTSAWQDFVDAGEKIGIIVPLS